MDQQIANRHLARDVGIGDAELRDVFHDPIVPLQLAVLDQQPQRHRGERLGRRGQREHRVLIDRIVAAQVLGTEAALVHDPIVLDDGDREARCAPLLACGFESGIETGQWVVVRACRKRKRKDESNHERKQQATHSELLGIDRLIIAARRDGVIGLVFLFKSR